MTTTIAEASRAICLEKIDQRFTNLDQKVFARRYLAYKLAGSKGNAPIPSRYLTLGEAREVKRLVDQMVTEAAGVWANRPQ